MVNCRIHRWMSLVTMKNYKMLLITYLRELVCEPAHSVIRYFLIVLVIVAVYLYFIRRIKYFEFFNVVPIRNLRIFKIRNLNASGWWIEIEDNGCYINRTALNRAKKAEYFGCNINELWDFFVGIKIRFERARTTVPCMQRILCCPYPNLALRMRMVRCFVFPVLVAILHGGLELNWGDA